MSKTPLSERSTREIEQFLRANGATKSQAHTMASSISRQDAESPEDRALNEIFGDSELTAALAEVQRTLK